MLKPKKILFITLLSLFVISFSGISQNSASASFTASVNIIEPISIQTTSNMNFASIDAREGGSITLNPNNIRTTSGSVHLSDKTGATAASFRVTGQRGSTYNISLPKSSYILSNGSQKITIRDFTSDFKSGDIKGEEQSFKVGATLDINPNQEPGAYTSLNPMQVTVNYN